LIALLAHRAAPELPLGVRRIGHSVRVDSHQRAMWKCMFDRIDDYNAGRIDLGALVGDLRGLFVEADPHDAAVRTDFEVYWAPLDAENELRTEPWPPTGRADDEALTRAIESFRGWVATTVLADNSTEHG
jgi:hypothetical protein